MNKKIDLLKRDFIKDKKLVILSLTKRCNLLCKYCRSSKSWYDSLSQFVKDIDLSKENWKKLKEFYFDNNIAEILLSWWEPLEYPYIKEFILYLIDNNIAFSIHTNWVSEKLGEIIGLLIEKNEKPNIHMSIELFDDLQKDIRWTYIPDNILKKLIDNNFNVEFKITLHNKNLNYINLLEKKLLYWSNFWIKSFRFQPVVKTSEDFDNDLVIKKDFINIINKLINIKENNKILWQKIRNSIQSFQNVIDILENKVNKKMANECFIDKQIIFFDTWLNQKTCKILWNRDKKKQCSDYFDLICCGFQS